MRKMIVWIVIAFVLCTLTVGLTPHRAYACSCGPLDPPQSELEQASAVFSGKVLSFRVTGHSPGSTSTEQPMPFLDPTEIVLEVISTWKGIHQSQVVVHTGGGGIGCGFEFHVGQSYFVYAYGDSQGLETEHCSRTTELENATEDLTALGAGKPPGGQGLPTAGVHNGRPDSSGYLVLAALLLSLGAGLRWHSQFAKAYTTVLSFCSR